MINEDSAETLGYYIEETVVNMLLYRDSCTCCYHDHELINATSVFTFIFKTNDIANQLVSQFPQKTFFKNICDTDKMNLIL